MKAAFYQEKALVGAFSVIVQLRRLIVYSTSPSPAVSPCPAGGSSRGTRLPLGCHTHGTGVLIMFYRSSVSPGSKSNAQSIDRYLISSYSVTMFIGSNIVVIVRRDQAGSMLNLI